ncbi:MAG: hypothetical protein HC884_09170 [Chloroflexaceae bacterium]|nr:hypothetical protein [Chloroflexaceae bacterium]
MNGKTRRSRWFGLLHGLALITLLSSIVLVFAGQGRAVPVAIATEDEPDIVIGQEANGTQITLNEGQQLVVRLEANPSTGYEWMVEYDVYQLADQIILDQVGFSLFEPPDPSDPPGTPTIQQMVFQPIRAGENTLKLVYRQPWEPLSPPQETFTLDIQSEGLFENLPTYQEIVVDESFDGSQVSLGNYQTLNVRLPTNPSTGYQWVMERTDETENLEVGTQPVLRQVGSPVLLAPEPSPDDPEAFVGSPVTAQLRFQPMRAGSTTLKLVYRRPWEEDLALGEEQTFTLKVYSVGSFLDTPMPLQAEDEDEDEAVVPPPMDVPPDLGLPSKFNWCDNGKCTPVKNQGGCGSCWAFATVGVFENLIRIRDGITRDLAEQYLVSCNLDGGSCNGGWIAHKYHVDQKGKNQTLPGAIYETSFPYQAKDLTCPSSPFPSYEKGTQWSFVGGSGGTIPSVAMLKQAIYEHGPVSVAVCADNWGSYKGGIFEQYCSTINHAVVLVGWDDSQGPRGYGTCETPGEPDGASRAICGLATVPRR